MADHTQFFGLDQPSKEKKGDTCLIENEKQRDNKVKASESIMKLLVFPKNSDEYKKEFHVLIQMNTLDGQAVDILYKFDNIFNKLNPVNSNAPLTEKNVKSLPNLFSGSIESNDYNKFLKVLFDISKSRLLTQSILAYLISYLEKVDLNDQSCFRNHYMISIVYMLLYFYYDENGTNYLNKNFESEYLKKSIHLIGMYLSNITMQDSIEDKLEPNFLKTCTFLKKLLHHKESSVLNFKARDICQLFGIKLDLSLMIRLCINGVKQENENIENLVLFIGNSGSGKSSTINYLSGIEYKLICSRKTQKYFLQQEDNTIIAPAKVGHGNISETLYPKIIQKDNLSFCDFPGFNDTRDENYKACASLGLPIAVHYAKNQSICAIVIVIEWETITVGKGNGILNTINTVHSLMRQMSNEVKLLYVITRPPIPPENKFREKNEDDDEGSQNNDDAEWCDSNRLAEKVSLHISSNTEALLNEYDSLKLRTDNEIKKIEQNIVDLDSYMKALSRLEAGSFETHGSLGYKILKYFDSSGMIEKGSLAVMKQNILNDAKSDSENLSSSTIDRIEKFVDQIFKELEKTKYHTNDHKNKNKTIIEEELNNERKKIIEKIDEYEKEIETINNKTEEKMSLITFLKNIMTKDIFIIRGFKWENKWEDHKDSLLKRLEEICNINNARQDGVSSFRIDGRSEQFSVVFEWTKRESKNLKNMLNDLVETINKITKLQKTIKELEETISDDDKRLRLALVSSRENESKIIQNLEEQRKS